MPESQQEHRDGTSERRRVRRGGRRISDLNTHDEAFVTPMQIASYLGVGRKQITKWIDAGTLPAYRFGDRQWRIRLDDARSFVASHLVRQSAASESST